MNYPYARTDANFTPLPAPLPAFPAAGGVFRDPSFNPSYPPQYVRVTDPSIQPANAFSVGSGNGDDAHFNLDDTLLWVVNDGAAIFVFGIVPDTMQVGLVCQLPISLSWGNGHFSQVNPNWFYTLNPQTGQLWKVDFTGINLANPNNNPPASLVFDFSKAGLKAPSTFAGIAGKDTVFAAYFGTQDDPSCTSVAVFDSTTEKCSVYNTQAGTVDGKPTSTMDSFYMHGAHLGDPTGQWMWVTKSTESAGGAPLYAWAVGSPIVLAIGPYNDGHVAANAEGFFNSASYSPAGFPSLLFRKWVDFGTAIVDELNTGSGSYDPTVDFHPTTKNDPDGKGGMPIFASTTAPTTALAYQNEIIAWQQPSGPVLRFGRTFNSGAPSELFQGQIAVGAVSPTGRFYAFTSDGEGTLGNGRVDVFLLALPHSK